MNKSILTITGNKIIAKNTFEMILEGDVSEIKTPGQFINIKLDGFYLRRPISVCDYDEKSVTIIYKTVGQGTKTMSELKKGATLDVLLGLGNGYCVENCGRKPLLIGGGAGVPPMYALAKKIVDRGGKPVVITGFNTEDEVFYYEEFKKICSDVIVTTVDGSVGIKGFVTDAVKTLDDYTYYYACGPEVMLKAVYDVCTTDGELSFEERMACGFGACMGCSCKTKYGYKRICKDGPVLKKEEIIW